MGSLSLVTRINNVLSGNLDLLKGVVRFHIPKGTSATAVAAAVASFRNKGWQVKCVDEILMFWIPRDGLKGITPRGGASVAVNPGPD